MTAQGKKYINWYKTGFEIFEKNLNGQSKTPVHKIRQKAFSNFVSEGFPTTKIEEWKYTNLEPLTNTQFKFGSIENKIDKSQVDQLFITNFDCYKVVFIDGIFQKDLSDDFNSVKDFTLIDLSDYIEQNQASDLDILTRLADYQKDSLVALNTAFMQSGIVIKVKSNTIIEKPFFVLFISTGAIENMLIQPRIILESAENSSATLIESHQGLISMSGFYNMVSEFYIDENARLNHIKLQNESEKTFHISNLFTGQEKNSYFNTTNINLGGKIVRNNVWSKLNGEGSECVLNGVYIGKEKQHIDNRTVIDHVKPNCLSMETYKGIMGDDARGVFNGKIHVHPDAQKTNAIQNNSGLLLSENASIDTKPQLEIYADDVKCTHGATIGQLDEDALFYLRSRAIGVQEARKMLINAFAGEVTDQIQDELLRENIMNDINNKLKLIT